MKEEVGYCEQKCLMHEESIQKYTLKLIAFDLNCVLEVFHDSLEIFYTFLSGTDPKGLSSTRGVTHRKMKDIAAVNPRSVSTQTLPSKEDTATQTSGCEECLSLPLVPENGMGGTCVRCEQVNDLLCLVAELKEEVQRLKCIRESEKEIDWRSQSLLTPKGVQQEVVKPCTSCHKADGADQVDGGEWKQVPDWRGKRTLSRTPSPPWVPLKNRYEALDPESQAENSQEDLPGEPPGLTPKKEG
ncbi:hypothetical protein WISP_96256 [Willisornis vidua]|uniref:Uncharacterized protein n=1 Tax=Willisornis vidua TaxID=1566151 RepID=A0ABQ9CZW5_9PASS|nr:hypothetical protein WISP_96256 [Willisornis vidua]